MYCDECGKEIPDNSEFCGYCGARVGGPALFAGQAVQPPAAGPQAYAPPPPPTGVPPAGQPAVPLEAYTTQAGPVAQQVQRIVRHPGQAAHDAAGERFREVADDVHPPAADHLVEQVVRSDPPRTASGHHADRHGL